MPEEHAGFEDALRRAEESRVRSNQLRNQRRRSNTSQIPIPLDADAVFLSANPSRPLATIIDSGNGAHLGNAVQASPSSGTGIPVVPSQPMTAMTYSGNGAHLGNAVQASGTGIPVVPSQPMTAMTYSGNGAHLGNAGQPSPSFGTGMPVIPRFLLPGVCNRIFFIIIIIIIHLKITSLFFLPVIGFPQFASSIDNVYGGDIRAPTPQQPTVPFLNPFPGFNPPPLPRTQSQCPFFPTPRTSGFHWTTHVPNAISLKSNVSNGSSPTSTIFSSR
jgi:hypothetical protein